MGQTEPAFVNKTNEIALLMRNKITAAYPVGNGRDKLLLELNVGGSKYTAEITKSGNRISYAGIKLTDNYYKSVTDKYLADYAAKELFYLLAADETKLTDYFAANKIYITLNKSAYGSPGFFEISSILPVITDTSAKTDYLFNYSDDEPVKTRHLITWTSPKGSFSISFPARADLILDMDKTEMDSVLYNRLQNIKQTNGAPAKDTADMLSTNVLIRDKETGLYIKQRDNLWGYSNDIILEREGDKLVPVNSGKYYQETILNCIQGANDLAGGLALNIEHKQYSGNKTVNGVPLDQLIASLNEDHLVLTALDDGKDSLLTTIIFYNRSLGYIHLIYFPFPFDKIMNNLPATAAAKMYSYIRLDNVKNYFDEYKEKERRFKVRK